MIPTASVRSFSSILGLAMLWTGCQTTGFERAEQTTVSMRELDVELDRLSEQVTATNGALGELTTEENADVKSLYESLVQGLEALESRSKGVEGHTSRLESRGEAYFQAWDEKLEMQTDADLKALSASRRADCQAAFAGVLDAVEGIHTNLGPYNERLGEIRTFLDTNLSRSGIQAIASKIEAVRADAGPVQAQIANASKALEAWTEEWAPPQPATPEPADDPAEGAEQP